MEKMTLSARIEAISFETLTHEDFDFLVERALKSVRPARKGPRKPSKAHEALVAMVPQVMEMIAEKGSVSAEDLGVSPQKMTALAKAAGLVKVEGTGKGKVRVAYTVAE